jgi:hypothetical protein
MALNKFTQIGETEIYERGNDTCEHPLVTLHAPTGRIAASDKWLVRIYDPRERGVYPRTKRSVTYAAKTRAAAVDIANKFKF